MRLAQDNRPLALTGRSRWRSGISVLLMGTLAGLSLVALGEEAEPARVAQERITDALIDAPADTEIRTEHEAAPAQAANRELPEATPHASGSAPPVAERDDVSQAGAQMPEVEAEPGIEAPAGATEPGDQPEEMPVAATATAQVRLEVLPNELVETRLNIRAAPSGDARVVGSLSPGDRAVLSGEEVNGYLPITTTTGRTGFVSNQFARVEEVELPPPPPPDTALLCPDGMRIELPLDTCPVLLSADVQPEHLALLLQRPSPSLYATYMVMLAPVSQDRAGAPLLALHTGVRTPPESVANPVLTSHLTLNRVIDELLLRVPPAAAPELSRYLLIVDPGGPVAVRWVIDGLAALDLTTGWDEILDDEDQLLRELLPE